MENATKALIIAGAVLIAIVLISVGVSILSSTSGVRENVDTTADVMEVETFNSQFTGYAGKNMSGSQVKSLLSKVIASNSRNPESQAVSIVYNGTWSTASDISTNVTNNISTNSRYNVTAGYRENGYIQSMSIELSTGT